MSPRHLAALLPLLLHAAPVAALPPPPALSLETAFPVARGGAPRVTAVTAWWLAGDLEAEARLGLWSAGRPAVRGADGLAAGLGLGWAPGLGRWRPRLGVDAGILLPAGGGARRTWGARLGAEYFPRRDLSLSLAAGWRWVAAAGSGAEAVLGLGYHP
jgi:hypothetical protein